RLHRGAVAPRRAGTTSEVADRRAAPPRRNARNRPGVSVTLVLLGLVALGLLTALVVFVAMRPVSAAYIFLATQPFVGGIDRGQLIPLFRPSEAIQLILTTAVLLGVVVRIVRGEKLSVRLTRLDRA